MPVGVTPSGQPMPRQLPQGWYYDNLGRIVDSAGRIIDPNTGQPTGQMADQNMPQNAPPSPARTPPGPRPMPKGAVGPDDIDPISPGVQRGRAEPGAGIHGMPGPEKYGPQDKYGPGMRVNTNQQGVQSNGDDDPWLIGAFEGGTYDPDVITLWYERAVAGDKAAEWVIRQVGIQRGMNMEDWAQSRGLTTYQEAFAPGGKYYRDPGGVPTAPAEQGGPGLGPMKDLGVRTVDPGQPGNTSRGPWDEDIANMPLDYYGNNGQNDPGARGGASAASGMDGGYNNSGLSGIAANDNRPPDAQSKRSVGGEIGSRSWAGRDPAPGGAAKRTPGWSTNEPLPYYDHPEDQGKRVRW